MTGELILNLWELINKTARDKNDPEYKNILAVREALPKAAFIHGQEIIIRVTEDAWVLKLGTCYETDGTDPTVELVVDKWGTVTVIQEKDGATNIRKLRMP